MFWKVYWADRKKGLIDGDPFRDHGADKNFGYVKQKKEKKDKKDKKKKKKKGDKEASDSGGEDPGQRKLMW